IFPLENGLANVGVGMMMSDMKKHNVNLQKAMEEIISKNPLFLQRFAPAKAVSPIKAWALPFGSKRRGGCTDGMLLVGDAFGLVDPFSGEGIGNAMLSGKIAAEVADEALTANNVSAEYLKVYENRVWEAVGGELDTSYKMQRLGKVEWLLNFVVSKAANSDRAREAIAGTFASQDAKKGYASPLFYLKLLFS
ncbi:MAG: NAD(P)/FAD-dependent oxidoreductase, partial [Candidatus Micrarchaeota archaeon]|nr:NAD(P)/FAD-dependent oxidoreductase [Candidatus Micrarchaeota archaeon]